MSNFLKLEGIVGVSDNPQHIGEIDILSAVLGYRIPNQQSAKIPRSGKVIGDVEVSKKIDEDSQKLLTAFMSGKTFPAGKITFESANKAITIEMSNVLIAAYRSDTSVETISLNYEKPT